MHGHYWPHAAGAYLKTSLISIKNKALLLYQQESKLERKGWALL
jgi:hypothetical protein